MHACRNASLRSLLSRTQQNNIGTICDLVSSSLLRKSLLQESADWFKEGADVLKLLVCVQGYYRLIQNHINEHLGGSNGSKEVLVPWYQHFNKVLNVQSINSMMPI